MASLERRERRAAKRAAKLAGRKAAAEAMRRAVELAISAGGSVNSTEGTETGLGGNTTETLLPSDATAQTMETVVEAEESELDTPAETPDQETKRILEEARQVAGTRQSELPPTQIKKQVGSRVERTIPPNLLNQLGAAFDSGASGQVHAEVTQLRVQAVINQQPLPNQQHQRIPRSDPVKGLLVERDSMMRWDDDHSEYRVVVIDMQNRMMMSPVTQLGSSFDLRLVPGLKENASYFGRVMGKEVGKEWSDWVSKDFVYKSAANVAPVPPAAKQITPPPPAPAPVHAAPTVPPVPPAPTASPKPTATPSANPSQATPTKKTSATKTSTTNKKSPSTKGTKVMATPKKSRSPSATSQAMAAQAAQIASLTAAVAALTAAQQQTAAATVPQGTVPAVAPAPAGTPPAATTGTPPAGTPAAGTTPPAGTPPVQPATPPAWAIPAGTPPTSGAPPAAIIVPPTTTPPPTESWIKKNWWGALKLVCLLLAIIGATIWIVQMEKGGGGMSTWWNKTRNPEIPQVYPPPPDTTSNTPSKTTGAANHFERNRDVTVIKDSTLYGVGDIPTFVDPADMPDAPANAEDILTDEIINSSELVTITVKRSVPPGNGTVFKTRVGYRCDPIVHGRWGVDYKCWIKTSKNGVNRWVEGRPIHGKVPLGKILAYWYQSLTDKTLEVEFENTPYVP